MATVSEPCLEGFTSDDAMLALMASRDPAPCPSTFPLNETGAKCYWIDNFVISLDDRFANAELPEEVDVVIIGSGISGAAAAYRLSEQQPDLRVAVLEARSICTGATGRNGGHIGRPEVYHFESLASRVGAEEALRVRKLILRNRDMMLETIEKLHAAEKVDLRLDGTMVVFENEEERSKFDEDLKSARAQGYREECTVLSPEEVLAKIDMSPESVKHGAAFLARCGTMYPRKLVACLFEAALDRMPSLSLHPNTPVSAVSQTTSGDGQPSYVVTTAKKNIHAKVVLHATNAYASHLMPSLAGADGVIGCQAHMMGVQPPASVTKQLDLGLGYADFWHWLLQRPNCGPFLYGLGTAEVLNEYSDLGTLADDNPRRKDMHEFLRTALGTWFPAGSDDDVQKCIEYDWTGVQGFTADGASIVGRPEKTSPGEFVSVGHNGEGMTRCFACATVAVDMILDYLKGNPNPIAPDWFPKSFTRDTVVQDKVDS